MRAHILRLAAAAAVGIASISLAHSASASIEGAKAECLIGERNDGYLGVVSGKSIDDALRREMRSINQQRKAAYARLAERNGVTIDVTARLTAEKLINGAGAGECVQNASGAWIKK